MSDPRTVLDACEAHVRAGRQLGPETVLWLISLARERWTARLALRAVLRAMLDGTGLAWTRHHWRPVLRVAADAKGDIDPPLPDVTGLDVGPTVTPGELGPRFVEQGEVHR